MQKGKSLFKSSDGADDAFTEKRAKALQRFLKRVVAHPELINDPLLHQVRKERKRKRKEGKKNKNKNKKKQPVRARSTMRTLALRALSRIPHLLMHTRSVYWRRVSFAAMSFQFLETDDKIPAPKKDLLAFIKIPPVEVDEWFDDKTRELSVLDNQLKKLHSAAQLLCEGRKDLSHHTDRFSKSFAALAQVEELKQLTSAMHRLADVEAKVHRLHSNQARRDMFDFSEIIFDYIMLVGSCKVALVQRGEKLKKSQEVRIFSTHEIKHPPKKKNTSEPASVLSACSRRKWQPLSLSLSLSLLLLLFLFRILQTNVAMVVVTARRTLT